MFWQLDSIKSRLQTTKQRVSIPRLALTVYQEEGIVGFYRGLWIPLMTISFVRTCALLVHREPVPTHHALQVRRPSPSTPGRRNTSETDIGCRVTISSTSPLSVASGSSHRSLRRPSLTPAVPRQWCPFWIPDLVWKCTYVPMLPSHPTRVLCVFTAAFELVKASTIVLRPNSCV